MKKAVRKKNNKYWYDEGFIVAFKFPAVTQFADIVY